MTNQPWYQSEVFGRCLVRKQPDVTGYCDATWHDFTPVVVYPGDVQLYCRFCGRSSNDLARQTKYNRSQEVGE